MVVDPPFVGKRHVPVLFALTALCAVLNVITLWDFHPRLAGSTDDNSGYYARRALVQDDYPGDMNHGTLQREYVFLSAPHWISYLAIRFLGIEAIQCNLLQAAIKPWLLVFSIYYVTYCLTQMSLASGLTAVVVLSGNIIPINLAMFGMLLFEPYQSDFAFPFALWMIAFLMERRLAWAFVPLFLLAMFHPSMTLACYGFLIASVFICRQGYSLPQKIMACLMFLPIFACISLPAHFVIRTLPPEDLGTARDIYDALNGSHGLLWEAGIWSGLLIASCKILSTLIPVFVSPSFVWGSKQRIVVAVIACSLVYTLFGLLAKQSCIWLYDSPWLGVAIRFHQLLLPRTSSFAMILTLVLVIPYLVSIVSSVSGGTISRVVAVLMLLLLADRTYPLGSNASDLTATALMGMLVLSLICSERIGFLSSSSGRELSRRSAGCAAFLLLTGSFILIALVIPHPNPRPRELMARLIPALWCLIIIAGKDFGFLQFREWFRKKGDQESSVTPHGDGHKSALIRDRSVFLWIAMACAATLVVGFWYTFKKADMDFWGVGKLLALTLFPLLAAVWVRKAWALAVGLLVLAGLMECYFATETLIPAEHPARAWHEAALWAKVNTPKESSFLMAAEYRKSPWGWCAWRTYAERGFVPLFEPARALVYIPNLNYPRHARYTRSHFQLRYPHRPVQDYFELMDAQDLAWLRDSTGARFAIGSRKRPLPATRVYWNHHWVIYDLSSLP